MGRRLISQTGRLLLIAAAMTVSVAAGSLLGWWEFLRGAQSEAFWDWVERVSWVSAFLAFVLMFRFERRARHLPEPTPPEPDPEPLDRNTPVNHDPERIRLEEELAGSRSGVILVHGPSRGRQDHPGQLGDRRIGAMAGCAEVRSHRRECLRDFGAGQASQSSRRPTCSGPTAEAAEGDVRFMRLDVTDIAGIQLPENTSPRGSVLWTS